MKTIEVAIFTDNANYYFDCDLTYTTSRTTGGSYEGRDYEELINTDSESLEWSLTDCFDKDSNEVEPDEKMVKKLKKHYEKDVILAAYEEKYIEFTYDELC